MKLIVGLGNPGSKYSHTRHNLGRLVIEQIAKQLRIKLTKQKATRSSVGSGTWDGNPVTVAYPEAMMNVSGQSVKALVDHLTVNPEEDLLVVVDDFALPFGQPRLRLKGSDGGHNGLKSVEAALGLQTYSRLRMGIGPCAPGSAPEEFVLGCFSAEESKRLPEILSQGSEACRSWVSQPAEAAMNAINSGQI